MKGYCQSSAPVELKHTWQLTACLLQIINGSLPTGRTISITTVVKRSRVRTVRAMPKRQKFSSCHEFSVKLSLCICSHTVLAVGIRMRYLAISGEDSSTYLLVCDKSCFVHSKSVHVLLAQARPAMINHHTSIMNRGLFL